MDLGTFQILELLALVERELLLFAGIFFLIGAVDELLVDGLWAWLKLSGRTKTLQLNRRELRTRSLGGKAAVFIPAWQEEQVLAHTMRHALKSWPQSDLVLYVGCYRNDQPTIEAAMQGAGQDSRVRIVLHDVDGPTTKADCLNRLYQALESDELRSGKRFRTVILHDAEDQVDPTELALMDGALHHAEFVQIPVLPLPQSKSRFVGSHYCEEFAEAHGKAMVVRDALDVGLPAAGVGCAFDRDMLGRMALQMPGASGPFSVESLTEDYELGMRIHAAGGRSRFLRVRGDDGHLIATRAYFPSNLSQSVRQKARWVHGIALQGWDRLGWEGGIASFWMRLRDRKGPMAAFVMACGYGFFMLSACAFLIGEIGLARPWQDDWVLSTIVMANLCSFAWRAIMRFAFTTQEFGWKEGLLAVLRIPVTNVIAIMAGRRAFMAYLRSLKGARPDWDKTHHDAHPAAPPVLREEAV